MLQEVSGRQVSNHAGIMPTKVQLVKAMVFPVVMYGCESWTVKKAEGRRIDAFELWCWRRLLRVPWTARRSNQSILNRLEGKPRTPLSSRVATRVSWSPLSGLKGPSPSHDSRAMTRSAWPHAWSQASHILKVVLRWG